jgi:hypothetical protein
MLVSPNIDFSARFVKIQPLVKIKPASTNRIALRMDKVELKFYQSYQQEKKEILQRIQNTFIR